MKQFSLILLALFTSIVTAQLPNSVQVNGELINLPENIATFEWSQMPEQAQYKDGYYGWVQFYNTPTQQIQNSLKANGVKLIQYIPNKTYYFYMDASTPISLLQDSGVRSILPVDGQHKLSNALKMPPYPAYAVDGAFILVTLEYHKDIDVQFVIDDLAQQQISVAQQYKGANMIDLKIPNNCLETLAAVPYVKWVELIVAPDVKEDTRGKSLHRSNGLDTQTTAGRNYTGEGVGVLVRDDGIVGPHIDFQGRIDNSGANGTGQSHGDGVAGILAGAGNLNPTNRGMAAGANVFVSNYAANFLDNTTTSLIADGDVHITNSSYGNGCNGGYTTIARTVDQQTRNNPSLLHVFSGGNSNNNNCGYGAGNQWGNITGGHKQGKNVIATANTMFDGSLANSSSRGPATDGRIKPDLAAFGNGHISTNENNTYQAFSGTSGASPGVAGVAAQLYETYADANGGTLPPSALIKAALMNTAQDAGNVGPDFKFGWGIINGLRAGKLIEDNRFLNDQITQGEANSHTITVPAGASQVRMMIYWSDVEAASGANPALVNDLDLQVVDPNNATLLPYVLDPTPNTAALDAPATNGVDRLNNVEQVVVNNPTAGTYTINVSGFNVPVGPQEYFVVYEVVTEQLTVTYPNDGESFVPGETESIHWDAINTGNDFNLEYSNDNGVTWNAIASITITNHQKNYAWNVPADVTANAKIRVTSGSITDESDGTFSIARQSQNVTFLSVCPTEATLSWDAVTNAESYDVYLLGDQYMEVVGTFTGTTGTVPITNVNEAQWAAVVAKNDTEGWASRRTIAVNHSGGLLNCSLPNDIAIIDINNTQSDFALICSGDEEVIISTTLFNPGINAQSNFTVSYQIGSLPPVVETFAGTINPSQAVAYEFATPFQVTTNGDFTLTISVNLGGDENATNDSISNNFFAVTEATPLDFQETFETTGFPPQGWNIDNPDNDETWQQQFATGINDNNSITAYIDNFSYNEPGEEDFFTTEIFDLSTVSNATVTFDIAKAQFSNTLFDGLRVEISTDCGDTFTTIYEKTGAELATVGNVTSEFTPNNGSQWRTEAIDISANVGGSAMFKFVNINGYGNSTFIDNINVTTTLGTNNITTSNILMFPNPANNQVNFTFESSAIIQGITIVNNLGQIVLEAPNEITETQYTMDVSILSTGLYFVQIKADGKQLTKKLLVK